MSFNFKTNRVYNLDVYPASIIPTKFQNAKLVGMFDFQTALVFDDIPAIHANVFPLLPAGTPNRPEDYEYLLFQIGTEKKILARQWINEETVKEVNSSKLIVTIGATGSSDIEDVRSCLYQNGYRELDIVVSN